jgi:hypothetical protein
VSFLSLTSPTGEEIRYFQKVCGREFAVSRLLLVSGPWDSGRFAACA